MLNVAFFIIMLCVIMLSFIMLSVTFFIVMLFHYAECRGA